MCPAQPTPTETTHGYTTDYFYASFVAISLDPLNLPEDAHLNVLLLRCSELAQDLVDPGHPACAFLTHSFLYFNESLLVILHTLLLQGFSLIAEGLVQFRHLGLYCVRLHEARLLRQL